MQLKKNLFIRIIFIADDVFCGNENIHNFLANFIVPVIFTERSKIMKTKTERSNTVILKSGNHEFIRVSVKIEVPETLHCDAIHGAKFASKPVYLGNFTRLIQEIESKSRRSPEKSRRMASQ